MVKIFDFKSGEIILNDFDFDSSIPTEEQIWSFKQDIIQARYQNDYVLDLGWYPEFNLDAGCFKLIIIKIDDWLNPVFIRRTKSIEEICEFINEAIQYVETISQSKS